MSRRVLGFIVLPIALCAPGVIRTVAVMVKAFGIYRE